MNMLDFFGENVDVYYDTSIDLVLIFFSLVGGDGGFIRALVVGLRFELCGIWSPSEEGVSSSTNPRWVWPCGRGKGG
jgi:hypothetical protein